MNLDNTQFRTLYAFLIFVAASFNAGCERNQQNTDSGGESGDSNLPKMSFHQPKDYASAVKRLLEIMATIESAEDLPAPKQFKVREVIHGTGSSAHSHFYLAESGEKPDHDHEESTEKIHDVTIDVFTELHDIARWLPKIAGDSDMKKSSWDEVNRLSKALNKTIKESLGELNDDQKKRAAIKNDSKSINDIVKKLDQFVAESTQDSGDRP